MSFPRGCMMIFMCRQEGKDSLALGVSVGRVILIGLDKKGWVTSFCEGLDGRIGEHRKLALGVN